MRILSHYFVTRFLGLFSMVLAAAFLVLATIELVLNLDEVSGFGADRAGSDGDTSPFAAAAHTLRYLGLRLTSYYLADVLPVASFLAVFIAFAIAGRAMELLAIEAGGVRPLRIVLPVLGTALILSLATAVLHETVILRATQLWSGESTDEQTGIDFGREAFWVHEGPLITNVGYADPETRTLFDVEIFERSPSGVIVRVVRTDRVHVRDDGRWQIDAARVWRFDAEDVSQRPVVENGVPLLLDLEALRGDALLGADPALLPLPALSRYLASSPRETSSTLRRVRGRYHERLASPWLVLVFAWLAMPFALRIDERGRIAGPAVAAVVALTLYFVVQTAGQTLAQEELIPVGVTPWITMALFSALAAFGFGLRSR